MDSFCDARSGSSGTILQAREFRYTEKKISIVDAERKKLTAPGVDEIKKSARDLAYDLMLYYPGNKSGEVPGILPGPPDENKGDYYWWQGGAMMGTYIDYWYLTGDETYNDVIMQGMLHQTSPNGDYQPRNYTASLGNDDQGFWGMSAMLAAENKFPNPPEGEYQWLELAQGVWNTQADPDRHDKDCNGGMRWQIPPTNVGYDYKNGESFEPGGINCKSTDSVQQSPMDASSIWVLASLDTRRTIHTPNMRRKHGTGSGA